MKTLDLLAICTLLFCLGCKSEPKETKEAEQPQTSEMPPSTPLEKSVPELLADAHGFQHWNEVDQLRFTFNVDRGDMHFERSWVWSPKTHRVSAISGSDTLVYDRGSMDSLALKRDSGFINDRYWLLAPFNLMWDAKSYTYEHARDQKAPISGEPMQRLTIVYGNQGGYTPGDAYDLYFGEDHIIREWVYRKSNQAEPSLITSWEDYVEVGGLKLARVHKRPDGEFTQYFSGIELGE